MNEFLHYWQQAKEYILQQPASDRISVISHLQDSPYVLDLLLAYRLKQPYLNGNEGSFFSGPIPGAQMVVINIVVKQLEICVKEQDEQLDHLIWSLYLLSKLRFLSESCMQDFSVDHHRFLMDLGCSLLKQQAEKYRLKVIELRKLQSSETSTVRRNELQHEILNVQLFQTLMVPLSRSQYPPHLLAQLGSSLRKYGIRSDVLNVEKVDEIENALNSDWNEFEHLLSTIRKRSDSTETILTKMKLAIG